MDRLGLLLIAACIVFGAVAQSAMKTAADHYTLEGVADPATAAYAFTGMALYGFSYIVWLNVLKYVPVSQAYPLISLTYPLVVFIGVAVFNEVVPATRYAGVFSVMVGCTLIARD